MPDIAKLIPRLFILRKSQMPLFDAHHVAYTRVNEQGTVSNIKAKGTPRLKQDFAPRAEPGHNIDMGRSTFRYDADPKAVWGISKEEMEHMIKGIAADVPDYTFKVTAVIKEDHTEFTLRGEEKNGKGGTLYINRDIYKKGLRAYHASFEASKPGHGIARAINRGCMHLYKRLGLQKVTVFANCDVGGYAWGKFGFVYENELAMRRFRSRVTDRLEECAKRPTEQKTDAKKFNFRKFTPREVRDMHDLISSSDPQSIWSLSDAKGKDGAELGKALLLNLSWHGVLDMKDPASMHRFTEYVTPKTEKKKVTQLSLF